MKTTKPNWNVRKLQRLANNGELRFDYPIQRASGQWDELQMSLLIHSIVGDYPVPPVAVVKAEVNNEEGEFVIDGKQRITNTLNFIAGIKDAETGAYPDNAYPLHEDTPEVNIEGINEPVVLAGKYFDELPEDAQSEILSANFSIQRMEEATDEEIEEIFNRWNNGTPLTKQQKARGRMGTTNATIISNLLGHNFIQEKASFTKLQRKRSDDEAVILQAMMLMSNYELPSNGFVADNILKFASEMRDQDITDVANAVKEALDYADTVIESKYAFLKKLHLPTFIMVAKKAKDDNVDKEVFMAWIEDFALALNSRTKSKALVETNYKSYMGAGSVKKDKVLGRKDAMISHFNEFVERYEPEIEEPADLPQGEKEEAPQAENEPMWTEEDIKEDDAKGTSKEEMEEVFAGLEEAVSKN